MDSHIVERSAESERVTEISEARGRIRPPRPRSAKLSSGALATYRVERDGAVSGPQCALIFLLGI